jgi:hypothetical protein
MNNNIYYGILSTRITHQPICTRLRHEIRLLSYASNRSHLIGSLTDRKMSVMYSYETLMRIEGWVEYSFKDLSILIPTDMCLIKCTRMSTSTKLCLLKQYKLSLHHADIDPYITSINR